MPPSRSILVVGASAQGLQAALTLARLGRKATLVEEGPEPPPPPQGWREKDRRWLNLLLVQAAAHPLIELLFETRLAGLTEDGPGFKAQLRSGPAWIDPRLCVDCGRCLAACPVTLPDGGHPLARLQALTRVGLDKRRPAPCRLACPLGMNVQGYLALIAQGRLQEASRLIRATNPLPGVCGRVCHHPCEEVCRRGEVDQPLAIAGLKRFAADAAGPRPAPAGPVPGPDAPRVAVIGSGPAGLTAVHDLALAGLRPTLVEAEDRPGGLLWKGIAPYRLPAGVLEKEIQEILALGVELRLNSPVRTWAEIEGLRAEGFKAVLLALGAGLDRSCGLEGEELKGVVGCLTFLEGLWRGGRPERLGRVAVIGGGNAAVEAARASLRQGADSVTILYRRTEEEMPADPQEVRQALEEGVELLTLIQPRRFEGWMGTLTGLRCTRMRLGPRDSSGRPRPVPVRGEEVFIPAETVIVSIGQGLDPACALTGGLALSAGGSSAGAGDRGGPQGPRPDWVHLAGDLVLGPSSVVQAMASGREAARRIIRALKPGTAAAGEAGPPAAVLAAYEPLPEGLELKDRRACPLRDPLERAGDCREVAGPLTPREAVVEASRCLNCGGCAECGLCVEACGLEAIDHRAREEAFGRLFQGVIVAQRGFPALWNRGGGVIRAGGFGRDVSAAKAVVAGRAAALQVLSGPLPLEPGPAVSPRSLEAGSGIGVLLCSCNGTLNQDGGLDRLASSLAQGGEFRTVKVLTSACHPEEGLEVEAVIREEGLAGLIIAGCACCSLDLACESCTEQRLRLKGRLFGPGGFSPRDLALVNLKETCLLPLTGDRRPEGLELGRRMILAALARLQAGRAPAGPVPGGETRVLVLGATRAGLAAAAGLLAAGREVAVVDHRPVSLKTKARLEEMGVDLIRPAGIQGLEGRPGGFRLRLRTRAGERVEPAGAVLLAGREFLRLPWLADPSGNLPPRRPRRAFGALETSVPGVFLASWTQASTVPSQALGLAGAGLVLEEGPHPRGIVPARVDPLLCRGCGRCAQVCPQGAARLEEEAPGSLVSWVDPGLCLGCGSCLAVCPTGAMSLPGAVQDYYQEVLDALLG